MEYYELNEKKYRIIDHIRAADKNGLSFLNVPLIDTHMLSDYQWQLKALKSRLQHPERYADAENVDEVVARLKQWIGEHDFQHSPCIQSSNKLRGEGMYPESQ